MLDVRHLEHHSHLWMSPLSSGLPVRMTALADEYRFVKLRLVDAQHLDPGLLELEGQSSVRLHQPRPFVTGIKFCSYLMIVANDVALSGRKLWCHCTLLHSGFETFPTVANSPLRVVVVDGQGSCHMRTLYCAPRASKACLPHPRRQSLLHLHGINGRTRVDDCKHRRIPVSGIRSSAIRASVTRTAARPPSIFKASKQRFKISDLRHFRRQRSGVHLDQGEAMFGIPLSPLRKCYSVHHSLWVDLRV
jgi:hypothetical protein